MRSETSLARTFSGLSRTSRGRRPARPCAGPPGRAGWDRPSGWPGAPGRSGSSCRSRRGLWRARAASPSTSSWPGRVPQRYATVHRQALLATIAQECDEAIMSSGAGGLIEIWNHAAGELFGWDEKDALGAPRQHARPRGPGSRSGRAHAQGVGGRGAGPGRDRADVQARLAGGGFDQPGAGAGPLGPGERRFAGHPGHHPAKGVRTGARLPGHARPPHRPAQPRPSRGPHGPCPGALPAGRPPDRGRLLRPRPLQDRQRHGRPRSRRQAACGPWPCGCASRCVRWTRSPGWGATSS